ncbi:hypothetical protein JCM5350_005378 [Sporobolomyces pararoseus]
METTLTGRDRVQEVGRVRDGQLGRLQLVGNLDLGDGGEFKEMISYIYDSINKTSTRVRSTKTSLESIEISKFGKTTLKVRSESTANLSTTSLSLSTSTSALPTLETQFFKESIVACQTRVGVSE